jgi:hypothetical protein
MGPSRAGGQDENWIHLAQNGKQHRLLVSMVMNHHISRKCGELRE